MLTGMIKGVKKMREDYKTTRLMLPGRRHTAHRDLVSTGYAQP